MLKMAWFGDHEVFCDEGKVLGGQDEFPPPLGYMAMALGFCTLTQLMRIAHMREVDIASAECTVEMGWWSTGSLAHGTAKTGCRGVRSRFEVESSESAETIAEVIRQAKDGCYVENLIRTGATIDPDIRPQRRAHRRGPAVVAGRSHSHNWVFSVPESGTVDTRIEWGAWSASGRSPVGAALPFAQARGPRVMAHWTP